MDKARILEAAIGLQPRLVEWRRRFHRAPELSGKEEKTTALIEEIATSIGAKCRRFSGMHGLIADIGNDATTLLRADIDALPGPEESGLPFASDNSAAHLCGHDLHIAMVLGAGEIIRKLGGNVRLLFQPMEEMPPGGAIRVVEQGALTGIRQAYALHVYPLCMTGIICSRPGPYFAAADNFEVMIKGVAGHAASPHTCKDAVLAASAVVVNAQAIVARFVPATEAAVLSFTCVSGGSNYNVLPQEVKLLGTIRSYSTRMQEEIFSRLAAIADETARIYGCSASAIRIEGYRPLLNSPDAVAEGAKIAEELFGSDAVNIEDGPYMFGEDFGRYTEEVPGALFCIGAAVGQEPKPLHNNRVLFDEDVLWRGASFMAAMALKARSLNDDANSQ